MDKNKVEPGLLPENAVLYVTAVDGSWEYGAAVVLGETGEGVCVFMEDAESCEQFGVRECLVYVLSLP